MSYFSPASYLVSSPVYTRRPISSLSSFVYFMINLLFTCGVFGSTVVIFPVSIISLPLSFFYPLRVHFYYSTSKSSRTTTLPPCQVHQFSLLVTKQTTFSIMVFTSLSLNCICIGNERICSLTYLATGQVPSAYSYIEYFVLST